MTHRRARTRGTHQSVSQYVMGSGTPTFTITKKKMRPHSVACQQSADLSGRLSLRFPNPILNRPARRTRTHARTHTQQKAAMCEPRMAVVASLAAGLVVVLAHPLAVEAGCDSTVCSRDGRVTLSTLLSLQLDAHADTHTPPSVRWPLCGAHLLRTSCVSIPAHRTDPHHRYVEASAVRASPDALSRYGAEQRDSQLTTAARVCVCVCVCGHTTPRRRVATSNRLGNGTAPCSSMAVAP
jgi:hypothetical protein